MTTENRINKTYILTESDGPLIEPEEYVTLLKYHRMEGFEIAEVRHYGELQGFVGKVDELAQDLGEILSIDEMFDSAKEELQIRHVLEKIEPFVGQGKKIFIP